jgi:pimeloyl-ACP methyl ester carboxylesterase
MLGLLAAAAIAAVPAPVEITAAGPHGSLAGTLLDPGAKSPVVLIVPGSGPTDRDGNSPLGITAAPYRLLADALATRGVASVRIDKRGMFGSKAAIADANAVTIADYAADVHSWVDAIRRRTGRACVWVLGHSEGGIVALKAAQQPVGICGVVLVSTPGRLLADTLRAQFRANPANAAILPAAIRAINTLEAGQRVDPATLPEPLPRIFPAAVQGFMIDLFGQRPAALAAALKVPVLVVQGDRDIQVGVDDARVLAAAAPGATLAVIPGANHVLKAWRATIARPTSRPIATRACRSRPASSMRSPASSPPDADPVQPSASSSSLARRRPPRSISSRAAGTAAAMSASLSTALAGDAPHGSPWSAPA